jgi:hypothetical protein
LKKINPGVQCHEKTNQTRRTPMHRILAGMAMLLMLSSGIVQGAVVSSDTAVKVRQLGDKAAAMMSGKPGEYARDVMETAQASITAAQGAVAIGNEKEALLKAELAELQLTVAEAKAAEKELLEQVAVRRTELKKLEAQLERYRQGEEN